LGWLGAGRLAELSVVDRPLGGRLARYGPSHNANFPFVLFGRARYHAGRVAERTHARRDVLELEAHREGEAGSPEQLSLEASVRRSLSDLFGDLTRHAQASAGHRDAFERLTRIICAILEQDEGQGIETR
jgi:hypothetical protein